MTSENKPTAVEHLQRHLRTLSYFDKRIPPVPIDGVFGTATEEAVRAFQEAEGLPVTGRVDQEAWEALCDRCARGKKAHAAPEALALFPRVPDDYRVSMGDKQFLAQTVRYLLSELSVLYEWPEPFADGGVYDGAAAGAVRLFQQKNGLPETGEVDRATWNALAAAYNQLFGGFFPQ